MNQFFSYSVSDPLGVIIAFLPISVVCACWVYFDARRLHSNQKQYGEFNNIGPLGWAALVLIFWLFAFPMYLIKRPLFKKLHRLQQALQRGEISQEEFERLRHELISKS